MSLDSDVIIERRRLRRSLSFWRVCFFLVAILAIGALVFRASSIGDPTSEAHIARVEVNGVILQDRAMITLLDDLREDDSVRGVILSINSPGGSTSGGERLYSALRRVAAEKPVVASIGTMGASAGYMIALGADAIYADYNSLTGSIGVLFQYGNFSELLEKVGVEFDAIKSSPLKAEPDFYSAPSIDAKDAMRTLIMDSYDWFVGIVAERRNLDMARALELANGQVYTGHQAKEFGLVDGIGDELAARAWLIDEKKLSKDLEVVTWRPIRPDDNFPIYLKGFLGISPSSDSVLGKIFSSFAGLATNTGEVEGLVSVWQAPSVANQGITGGKE
ncbi:signal peptide peptidase SppA [Polycladidibacter hongkongensis]|uniref:signal peptide peptidase SppA n=1 Tax=Polycladidibacter hongkongensis TaxID=1647556 RepID=UPI00082CB186|nr:signal peptide peptidase SppA [Pseudovibrio hongkongensis]